MHTQRLKLGFRSQAEMQKRLFFYDFNNAIKLKSKRSTVKLFC